MYSTRIVDRNLSSIASGIERRGGGCYYFLLPFVTESIKNEKERKEKNYKRNDTCDLCARETGGGQE